MLPEKPYTPHRLADDLETLARQIRTEDPRRLSQVLECAELEDGFVETVRALVAYTKPPTDKEVATQQYVEDAVRLSKEPFPWPEVSEPIFVIIVDFDDAADSDSWGDLVLRIGDQEIYRRPTWYENANHLVEACIEMRNVYKARVKGYELTDAAMNCMYGDDFRAPGKIRNAFRKIMRDYQKERERLKRESEAHPSDDPGTA